MLDFLPKRSDYPPRTRIKKITKDYDGDLMKMGSQRYYTFAKSLECVFCSIKGTRFYKERSMAPNGQSQTTGFHFNLYAIDKDGNEVLMTKDHIVAKSLGGKNRIDNYATSCTVCNSEKGSMDFEEFKELKRKEICKKAKAARLIDQSVGRLNRKKTKVEVKELDQILKK